MWSRAVWVEGDKEIEETIPSVWLKGTCVFWPKTGAKRLMSNMAEPDTNTWLKFSLLKEKFKSANKKECDDYTFTTSVETSSEEDEEITQPQKRKPKKKQYPDYETDDQEPISDKNAEKNTSEKAIKDQLKLPNPPKKVPNKKNPALNQLWQEFESESQSSGSRSTSISKSHSSSRNGGKSQTKNPLMRSPSSSRNDSRNSSPLLIDSPRLDSRYFRRSSSRSPVRGSSSRLESHNTRRSSSRSHVRGSSSRLESRYSRRSRSWSPVKGSSSRLESHYSRRSSSRSSVRGSSSRLDSRYSRRSRSRSPVKGSSSRLGSRYSRRSSSRSSVRGLSSRLNSHCSRRSSSRSPVRRSSSRLDSHYSRRSSSRSSVGGSSSRLDSNDYRFPSTSTPISQSWQQRTSTSERSKSSALPELSRPKAKRSDAEKFGSLKLGMSDFPLTDAKFQKQVLLLLLGIRDNINIAIGINDNQGLCVDQCDTDQELAEWEEKLADKSQRAAMKKYFKRLGGMDAGDMVKKSMASILSNKLMGQMNMTGKLNKPAFGSLQICKVIREAVLEVYPKTSNQTKITDEMARYLRYAKDRIGGGGRKKTVQAEKQNGEETSSQ